ncbi:transcription factor ICE1 [Lactuca sativa]|uniref:BHLH domain-containing protein n=1 Tax=Lactuca sativa TaxID=4236 RepID=A0A9R1VEQ8_LACSA|nr:transcription factor ICE1 [Lactuca sativa]KAJ0203427.1 hypothetical protein LSAT_V11C500232970 [Lactuca sativa]
MLSRVNSVVWMDDERGNQTNHKNEENNEINSISTFKSMLEVEEENNNNWFLQQQSNLLLQQVDSSSSCSPTSAFQNLDPNQVHFFLPPRPSISSILNPISSNPLDETFDLGCGNGILPGFCDLGGQTQMGVSSLNSDPQFSTAHLLQLAGNGFGTPVFPSLEDGLTGTSLGLNRSKLLKPLDSFASAGAPPTLFQKRAALRRNLSDINTTIDGDGGGAGLGRSLSDVNTAGGGGSDGMNEKKRKSSGGSWDDVDNLSLDGSGLNYDSDDITMNTTTNFEENGIKINGGNSSNANSTVTGGIGSNQKGKKKGLPAKNLMAERRRRKKLNDRLYMLRSVVPKISKMDRASILGDAIEYLKELLQKINDLNYELESTPSTSSLTPTTTITTPGSGTPTGFYPLTPTPTSLPSRIKEELCPTAIPSPTGQPARVEVRQREGRAVNIHMFCSRRPGLLLSTMRALDNLGLDIQQAVISCFNGFALDVFRAEQCKEGQDVHPDQVKAVLLESAGYHGVA